MLHITGNTSWVCVAIFLGVEDVYLCSRCLDEGWLEAIEVHLVAEPPSLVLWLQEYRNRGALV
jgi:hypothetical protein